MHVLFSQLFFFWNDWQVPDGVNTLIIGKIGTSDTPLAITGGNCSLQGFDFEGNDLFWTVNLNYI